MASQQSWFVTKPAIDDQARTLVQERPGMLPLPTPVPAPRRPRPPRRSGWLMLLLVPVSAVVVLDQRTGTTSTAPPAAPQTALASRGRLIVKVLETGKVQSSQEAGIHSRVGGVVIEVPVKEGQEVRAGDVLVRLDPTEYEREVSRRRADLEERQAVMTLASWRKRSAESRLAEHRGQHAELREARHAFRLARARLKVSLATLRTAQDQLGYATLLAPFAGRVIARHVHPGQTVVPALSLGGEVQPLVVLASMQDHTVRVDLDPLQFSKVRLGQPARITMKALPGRVFAGRVTSLFASSLSGVRLLPVKVQLQPHPDLQDVTPGLLADVGIEVARRDRALLVPFEAVTIAGGKQLVHVWSAERRGYFPQQVRTGEFDDRQIEITGGLAEGARVRLTAPTAARL